ncbi:MAG: GNAT family N-acetyltransferase [Taibaiella sp.]|jgi:GNAT superfamily N-acetyltransferase
MNLTIRIMGSADAAVVNTLSAQLGYVHSVQETLERMQHLLQSEYDCLLVALWGDDIAGWVHAFKTTRLEAGNYTEIAALVVDEQFRGKKIGEQLVNAIKEWGLQQGYRKLVVRSNVLRNRAHHFYLICGFTEVKEHKVFELHL